MKPLYHMELIPAAGEYAGDRPDIVAYVSQDGGAVVARVCLGDVVADGRGGDVALAFEAAAASVGGENPAAVLPIRGLGLLAGYYESSAWQSGRSPASRKGGMR